MPVPETYPSKVTKTDFIAVATEVNLKMATSAADTAFGAHRARVSINTAVSVPNATFTALVFDTEEVDTAGLFNPAAPTRLTIPAGLGGAWLLQVQTHYASGGTGFRQANIVKNGSIYVATSNLSPEFQPMSTATTLELVAGDYIESHAYHSSGASRNTQGGKLCWLSAVRLGA